VQAAGEWNPRRRQELMRPLTKKSIQGLLIGVSAAIIVAALNAADYFDRWEYNAWALRVRAFAHSSPATDRIKIILLDQASLDWGKNENGLSWPWPREMYAPLLAFCKRGGAKVVAFDVLYTEPSVYGVYDDEVLGAAIKNGPAFVGAVVLGEKSGDETNWPNAVPPPRYPVRGLDHWVEQVGSGQVVASRATFPIPEVATNAALLGNVSDEPDDFSVFTRAALFRVFDGKAVPSLGLAAYLADWYGKEKQPDLHIAPGWLTVNGRKFPIDSDGQAILRFVGPVGTHESFSAAAVIQSEIRMQSGEGGPVVNPEVFRDKYVFFGFSAPALLDLRPTPISKVSPGVEIHATTLDNLLTQMFLRDVPVVVVNIYLLALAVLSGLLGALSRKAYQSVIAFLICLPIPAAIGVLAYGGGMWWPIVSGETAVALSLIGAVVVNYATEGRQKAFIKQAFKRYISPAYIEQMLVDPGRLKLGGEKRELSIFFSDLQGFSSISEKLDPTELTSLLNEFLTDMTDLIMEEGGTLDKYEGDAIIAFWNAPIDEPDHAIRVCRTALRCQRKLTERREALKAKYHGAELYMRVGINTGDVVVGNMGSRNRFNYTILGDAANLASRLEGANKAFGTYLMVSEFTWLKTGGQFIGRQLGKLRVVGRETPVRVFEVIGMAGESIPQVAASFEEGLELCYERKWTAALEIFESYPDDPPSQRYAARCRQLIEGVREEWDGVWNLTEK